MKKLFYAFFTLGLFSVAMVSCSDDNKEKPQLGQGVGDIMSFSGSTMKILMDSQDTVLITNATKYNDFDVDTRVAFFGEIISVRKETYKFYEFRVHEMNKVLTKKPLLKSDLDADKDLDNSIGDDNIVFIKYADITSKYLNINFVLLQGGLDIKHFINLVVDDTKPITVNADGELELNANLRQNAYEDIPRYESLGFVSFDIDDYLSMHGLKKIKINIRYKRDGSTATTKTVELDLSKPLKESMSKSKIENYSVFTSVN